jgi:hypothetical protein
VPDEVHEPQLAAPHLDAVVDTLWSVNDQSWFERDWLSVDGRRAAPADDVVNLLVSPGFAGDAEVFDVGKELSEAVAVASARSTSLS